jgi:hypothetical protein
VSEPPDVYILKFVSTEILTSRSASTRSGAPCSDNAAIPTCGKKESDAAFHMRFDFREQRLELFSEDPSHHQGQNDHALKELSCLREPLRSEGWQCAELVRLRRFAE